MKKQPGLSNRHSTSTPQTSYFFIGNMASTSPPSVLIIGASGYLGKPMCAEFLAQRSKFKRIAILTTEEKKAKFAKVEADGLELVLGSFTDPSSFKGSYIPLKSPDAAYCEF